MYVLGKVQPACMYWMLYVRRVPARRDLQSQSERCCSGLYHGIKDVAIVLTIVNQRNRKPVLTDAGATRTAGGTPNECHDETLDMVQVRVIYVWIRLW